MSSFWKDNLEIKKYPSLTKNLNTDVCIIGGGITGISCGYYLAKNNLKVCILEKDTIMNKTSGYTTAKITAQHGLIYKYLVDSYSEDFAKKYLKSNLEAIENIKKIVDDEKINCDYEIQNSYVYTTVPSSIIISCNGNYVKAKYIVIATRYPIINFPGFYFLKMYSETSKIYNSKRLRPIKNRKELGNMIKETTYSLVLNKFDLPKAEIEDINLEEGKIVNYNDHRIGVHKDKNNNIFKVIQIVHIYVVNFYEII